MSNCNDWFAEAHAKGRAWYRHRQALRSLDRPPLSLAACQSTARSAADTWLTLARLPRGAADADKASLIAAFVQGAVEAWHTEG
jgi:hypothetical protein